MPTKAQIAAKKKTAAAKKPATKRAASTSRASTAKATEAKTTAKPGKRAAAGDMDAKNTTTVVKMRSQGKPWSEIAESISTTPGKAQFLMMKHRVAEGEVAKISTNGKPEQVLARLVKARTACDEFASWGWISARSGLSEGVIKKMLADSGDYEPRAVNIAAQRAENNGTSTASKTTGTPKRAAKKPAAKTGAAAAKAKAAARKKKSNPSS